MATTVISQGDKQAAQKYSVLLANEAVARSFWQSKTMGKGEGTRMPIMMLTDLESDAGDTMYYDLSTVMNMEPVQGDGDKVGKEDKLSFYYNTLKLDQLWAGIDCGGRMTRKRTKHNLREVARRRSREYWPRVFDELFFIYGSGLRGDQDDYLFPTDYTGFAGNSLSTPDSDHKYVANGKSTTTMTTDDTLTLDHIGVMQSMAETQGGGPSAGAQMPATEWDGAEHYVYVMHTWSAHDLKYNSGSKWWDLQKALVTAEGNKAPYFKGSLGIVDNVVLQKNRRCIRLNSTYADSGGTNVPVARNLFFGAQAMVCGFGMRGSGTRYGWHEEITNRGENLVIDTYTICGIQKNTFNSADFSIIANDVAASDPKNDS